MLRAYKRNTNDVTYYVSSDRSGETYPRRDQFKRVGAKWDGHHWIVDEEQRLALNIPKMVWVRVQPCHGDDKHLVLETKAIVGQTVDSFCGMCDSRSYRKVLEVLDN